MVQKLSNPNNKDFWDNLGGIEVTQNDDTDFWNNLEGVEVKADIPEDSWGDSLQALGRGAISGVVDTLALPANALIGLHNARLEQNATMDPKTLALADPEAIYIPPERVEEAKLPSIPSASQALVGGESNTPLQQGLEFGTSVLTPAGVAGGLAKVGGKVASSASKLFGAIGSSKPLVVGGAAAGGATSQYLQNEGFGTGSQLAGGLGADLGFQALSGFKGLKNIPGSGERLAMRALGLTKDNLKLDALESAKRLGVDLPTAAATNSVSTSLANELISKTPYYGDKLRNKFDNATKTYQEAWTDLFDTIAPERNEELLKSISSQYKKSRELAKNDTIKPVKVIEAIQKIRTDSKAPDYIGGSEKMIELLNRIEKSLTNLPNNFDNYPAHIQEKILKSSNTIKEIPVTELINYKSTINSVLGDKDVFKPDNDKGVLNLLKAIPTAMSETISVDYGKKNPAFKTEFQTVEKKFAQSAKRKALEDKLSDYITDPVTREVKFHPLINMIDSKEGQGFLKQNLGNETYKKLEDFLNVAQALRSVKANTKNPSGTAYVSRILNFITGIWQRQYTKTAIGLIGVHKTTDLLTDKRFLNKAMDLAKKPSEPLAKQLEAIVKDNTGYTLHELNRLYEDENQEKKE